MLINVVTYFSEADAAAFEITLPAKQDGHSGDVQVHVTDAHMVGEHQTAVMTAAVLGIVPHDEWLTPRPRLLKHLKHWHSA